MPALRKFLFAAPLLGAAALGHADEQHPFTLPGSDTTVTVGGYAKLDALWSDRSTGVDSVGDMQFNPGSIPVGPSAGARKRDQVTLHARQSRLWLGTRTPTERGTLRTYIEGDFFGADGNESSTNSNGLRVRHAYGVLGNLLAGQTWTNFFDERAYAETLDFGGPAGQIFVRQAQVRWTQAFSRGTWSIAAENPESLLAVPGTAAAFRSDNDHAPDLTARVSLAHAGGTYSLGLLVREIALDSAASPAASGSKWGAGLALAGVVPTGGRDDVRFDLNVGNAIGRYQTLAFLPDGYVAGDGTLRLARQASGFLAFRHFWSERLRSTVEVSAVTSTPPDGTAQGVNRSDRSQHVNLIWSPVTAVNLGAELIHGERTVVGGDSGRLDRLQLSAQYLF